MSKLTQIWKYYVRPKLSFGPTVPAPRTCRSAIDLLREAGDADGIRCRRESIPKRFISDPDSYLAQFLEANEAHARAATPLDYFHESTHEEFTDFCVQTPGSVAGIDGAVIAQSNLDPAGVILADVTGSHLNDPSPLNPLSTGRLRKPRSIPSPLAVLTCWSSDNYYHWLVDVLAGLRLMEPYMDSDTKLYAPQRKRFQLESLRAMGFREEQFLAATHRSHVSSPNVIAASVQTHKCSKADVQYLYDRLAAPLVGDASERVFISRRRRGRRRLVNEREVFDALKPLGFRRVVLEDLNFREQIQLFASCECIVAPHGAGLANLVFAHPEAQVLEITTPYRLYGYHCFWQIASHRNLGYRTLVAEPIDASYFDPNAGPGDSNIFASPKRVITEVASLLATSKNFQNKIPGLDAA